MEDPIKYFSLSNYGSNQNQKTSAYDIENQTQCYRILTLCHTILHLTVMAVKHPFQLSQ
jgi:hypothetical protein